MLRDRQSASSHGRASAALEAGCQMALVAIVVVACIAGIPPVVDSVVQSFARTKADAPLACRMCGTVEDVREVNLGAAKYGVSTVSGEGFAMLIGLLTGKLGAKSAKIYEVEVLLQDGSVRVIREGAPSAWKPGDHVRIVMGRIKPVS
jgi:hypothetical protein